MASGSGQDPLISDAPRLLSLVVPIFREADVLREFYATAKKTLLGLEPLYRHELIFVDDGSNDQSPAILLELAQSDAAVRIISLARNFGHQLAITAGLDHATGDVAVVMDGDLQDPPQLIPKMLEKWREGFKVVYGVRESRQGEHRWKLIAAKLFYRLLSHLSDVKIPLDSGDFRLLDRVVLDALGQIREENRYLRGLISWVGFPQCPLPYVRQPRYAGRTKYSLRKLVQLAFDGISSFSEKPLRLSSHLGFLVTIGALLLIVWTIIGKMLHPADSVPGWTSVMDAVLFLGGIQLMCIGILGEYVGRIFREAKGRPLYIIADRINFDSKPDRRRANGAASAVPKSPGIEARLDGETA
jgi:polyisoprenyl-phosphate glycosyltransferase